MFYLLQDDKSATCFLLHCQKFIELVRVCFSPIRRISFSIAAAKKI